MGELLTLTKKELFELLDKWDCNDEYGWRDKEKVYQEWLTGRTINEFPQPNALEDIIIPKLYENDENYLPWCYKSDKGEVLIIRADKELKYIENALSRIKIKLETKY